MWKSGFGWCPCFPFPGLQVQIQKLEEGTITVRRVWTFWCGVYVFRFFFLPPVFLSISCVDIRTLNEDTHFCVTTYHSRARVCARVCCRCGAYCTCVLCLAIRCAARRAACQPEVYGVGYTYTYSAQNQKRGVCAVAASGASSASVVHHRIRIPFTTLLST